jgi:hypothetical protein
MQGWPSHSVHTRNVSIDSENKIHDDAEARKYGFSGGLVPGTVVYAHLTYPLVSHFGLDWLSGNVGHLVLFKPAYEDEHLTVRVESPHGSHHTATAHVYNDATAELARLETGIVKAPPAANPLSTAAPAPPGGERIPIAWDAVVTGKPLRAFNWTPSEQQQEEWCRAVSDTLPIYQASDSPVHPGLILQAANKVLSHHYVLKPWIHTESRIVTRGILRLGKAVEVRAVPVERWEQKGHQFFKVYVAMFSGGDVRVEVYHSAIFQVRLASPPA